MNDPIKIMDEIESEGLMLGAFLLEDRKDWQSLRTAIEAQAEELAQVKAALNMIRNRKGKPLAAVKAEALREYAEKLDRLGPGGRTFVVTQGTLRKEADRIEREAIQQNCWHCGNDYNGFGEVCPDCRKLCDCRWDLGIGPNLKCPIHGSKREAKES